MTTVTAVAAQSDHAPSFRVRVRLLIPSLRDLGVDVRPTSLLHAPVGSVRGPGSPLRQMQAVARGRRRMLQTLRDPADAVLVQRRADVLPTLTIERAARRASRLVLDVDDAVWLDASRAAGGHRLAFLKGTARKLAWLARSADHVMAGNEYLADWLSQHSDHVTIVPSTVDVDATPTREHREGPAVVLGWIGSRTTFPYLLAVADHIGIAARALAPTRVELHIVGGGDLHIPGVRVRSRPWSEAEEATTLAGMDIGLMPLPDNEWTRGKCAYKALLYMSAGIPVIADDVGVSSIAVGHGTGGLIASTRDEWVEAITVLGSDIKLRARLGAGGRERARRDWSVARWSPVVARILRGF